MAQATLIHSPGGGSATDEDLARAKELLSQHFPDLEVKVVGEGNSPGDLAREALAAGSTLLIASGGDGTVSSVGGALVGHAQATLGILPRGTANSIGGSLGIKHDLDRACQIISEGHTRVIDTADVNGQPSLLMATIGVHAEAVTDVDPALKKRWGALAYLMEEIGRMIDSELFTVSFESDGQKLSAEANAVTVANISRPWTVLAQGGGTIEENDGLLDVTLVAIQGFAEAFSTSLHLLTNALRETVPDRDNIGHFRTREVRIETTPPKRVMVDGEDATTTPLVVRCIPKSLRVLVPKPA